MNNNISARKSIQKEKWGNYNFQTVPIFFVPFVEFGVRTMEKHFPEI